MAEEIAILLIDDDEDDFFLTQDYLNDAVEVDATLDWASTLKDGYDKACSGEYDLLLIDYRLGARSGLDLLDDLKEKKVATPAIILTGKGDEKIAVEAMKAGALDYLAKAELDERILQRTIRYAQGKIEQKKALEREQARYKSLFEGAKEAIFILDQDLQLLEVNPYFKDLLGSVREGSTSIREFSSFFIVPEDFTEFKKQLLLRETVKIPQTKFRAKDGSKVVVSIYASQLDLGEGESRYQGIIHDISSILKAEEEIRIAEKLSMTGRLARAIAHEVRNPLTNILLSVRQLQNNLEENATNTMMLDIVQRNGERINELITDLLESSKPSVLSLQPTDMRLLLEETRKLFHDRVVLLGITLHLDLDVKDPQVSLDGEKVKIAFLNIVTNAIEAMAEVDQPCLDISIEETAETVTVFIEDNGIGMSAESKSRLFDPFFTGKKSGMGLGMTTTRSILDSHKADIQVESELGKGTLFGITFPRDRN